MRDMMSLIREPWLVAFHPKVNEGAWEKIGIKPFTRLPLVNYIKKKHVKATKSGAKFDWSTKVLKDLIPEPTKPKFPALEDVEHNTRIRTGDLAITGPVTESTGYNLLAKKKEKQDEKADRLKESKEEKE